MPGQRLARSGNGLLGVGKMSLRSARAVNARSTEQLHPLFLGEYAQWTLKRVIFELLFAMSQDGVHSIGGKLVVE